MISSRPVGKIGNSGNIKFLKIHINLTSTVKRTAKKKKTKKVCFDLYFFKTLFQSVFLLLIFETMQLDQGFENVLK